jgi:ferredoxin-type protein NapG
LPEDNNVDRRDFFRHGLRNLVRTVADSVDAVKPGVLSDQGLSAEERAKKFQAQRAAEAAKYAAQSQHSRLRPPGALPEQSFLTYCTPCDDCFEACPVDAIVPVPDGRDDAGTPQILPSTTACGVCNEMSCISACDTGALQVLDGVREIDIGLAVFDEDTCLAHKDHYCDACVSVCPVQPRAISMLNGIPSLVPELCIGCGLCEQFCPTWPKSVIVQNDAREAYHVTQDPAPVTEPSEPKPDSSQPDSAPVAAAAKTATEPPPRKSRKIEPVEMDLDDRPPAPSTLPRPLAAFLLWTAPLFATIGLLGWARLLFSADLQAATEFKPWALLLDVFLLSLFILPHSIFARGIGRKWLNIPLGPCGERPLYVFITGVGLCLMSTFWQTTGPVLWSLSGVAGVLANVVQGVGMVLATWAAFVVGGVQLLGLPHLRALATGRTPPGQEFIALPPYSVIRQPINLGILLALLGMPEVTLDRFVMGVLTAAWIFLIAPYEERDAEMIFGEGFKVYKERTPRWWPKRSNPEE